MGAFIASRMGDEESMSGTSTEEDTDSETNYAQIFQRLINRVTNGRFIKSEIRPTPYRIKHKPDTLKLDHSEFLHATNLTSGLECKRVPTTNIASMLLDREGGRLQRQNFSRAERCRITNNFLPNKMDMLDYYDGKVFCGIFSKDGNYFVTAAQDKYIRLYDTAGGRYSYVKSYRARDVGWSIIDMAFSPDGENFVYSTWSTSLHLCSVNGDPEHQTAMTLANTARRFCIFSLAFSSNGREILGGASDGYLYIYDRQRDDSTLKIGAHKFDINTVAFADDSSEIIYSGGDDGLVKVWDRRCLGEEAYPNPVGTLAGHVDGITHINPKGDGRHLISNSKDQSIKLWDVRVFSTARATENTMRIVNEQTWDYRWQGVPKELYNTKDRLDGDTSIMTYRGHIVTRTLIRCRFSPVETTGQRYIYTGCGGGRLVIYDALTGKIHRDERRHAACVRDVAWHPFNNEILTSSWDGCVGRWYYAHREPAKEVKVVQEKLRRSQRIANQKRRDT